MCHSRSKTNTHQDNELSLNTCQILDLNPECFPSTAADGGTFYDGKNANHTAAGKTKCDAEITVLGIY